MGKKCVIFSFFLLLMHCHPISSLIQLLFTLQSCKHMKHDIKRVKYLIITKTLADQVIKKIYQNKLKLLPKLITTHLLSAFK